MNDVLHDKDAIRELLADYCFRLDGYELAELGRLFTPTGEWISRNGQARGLDGIEAFMRQLVPQPGPGTRRKHFTTNIIIDVDGDSADVRSNFLVVRDAPTGPAIAVAGTYRDRVVRFEGKWRFQRRELFHDIAGESGLNR